MTRKFIPEAESFSGWKKDPKYVAEYEALSEEFALASATIKARGEADMTQEELAAAMGTTQAAIARLESGKVPPSTRTLERYARATHTRLRISFERENPGNEVPRWNPARISHALRPMLKGWLVPPVGQGLSGVIGTIHARCA